MSFLYRLVPTSPSCTAQMKAAREADDQERLKRLQQRIKEVFFEAHGGSFTMAAFKHARPREDFG